MRKTTVSSLAFLSSLLFDNYAKDLPMLDIINECGASTEKSVPGNAYELLFLGMSEKEEERALASLALVGALPRVGGSDYEKFRGFCRCAPSLIGSDLYRNAVRALASELGWLAALSEKNCDRIWRLAAERLPRALRTGEPRSRHDGIIIPSADRYVYAARGLPTLFRDGKITDADALDEAIGRFVAESGNCVSLTFGRGSRFVKPNKYASGEALRRLFDGEALDADGADMLACEAIRFLCRHCAECGTRLELIPEGGAGELLKLLDYIAAEKMLPELFFGVTGDAEPVLALAAHGYVGKLLLLSRGGYSRFSGQLDAMSRAGVLPSLIGFGSSDASPSMHTAFRRALCDTVAENYGSRGVEHRIADAAMLVADICFNNSRRFFELRSVFL